MSGTVRPAKTNGLIPCFRLIPKQGSTRSLNISILLPSMPFNTCTTLAVQNRPPRYSLSLDNASLSQGTSPAPFGTLIDDPSKAPPCLSASTQMTCEECFCHCEEGESVRGTGKPMTFIGGQNVGRRNLSARHRFDNLIRLRLLDARIVRTLTEEQGTLNLINKGQRRS